MVLTSGVENTPTRTAHLFTYLSCYLSLRLSVQSPRSNTFYETLTYFLKKKLSAIYIKPNSWGNVTFFFIYLRTNGLLLLLAPACDLEVPVGVGEGGAQLLMGGSAGENKLRKP